ncbi:MAG: 3'-5' exonuclease, partial [Dehalococcoidales bacterium]|nr:3'-5' exonuclease [Dehalococcoidales bacterium]
LGISSYDALKHLLETRQSPQTPAHPFTPRAADALMRFITVIEDCIKKSREVDLIALFDFLTEASGYKVYTLADPDGQERWDNVLELRSKAEQYKDLPTSEALMAFLENVALVSDTDSLENGADRVTLITLHQAKGLEFPVVFIVGVEEKILPHIRSFDDPDQMEEERRVFYVGITRAKLRVYLLHSFRRNFQGQSQVNAPSRFLDDIPKHLTKTPGWQPEKAAPATDNIFTWTRTKMTENTPTAPADLPEFKDGERVRHAQFGEGVVVTTRKSGADVEVTVAFKGAGIKRLLLSYAKLEKI